MSFKAIDAQVMVNKSNEVSRLQQIQQQQSQQQLKNAMISTKDDFNRREIRANQLDHTEKSTIDDKDENEKEAKKHKQQKEKAQSERAEEKEINMEKHLGSIFDLRI